MASGSKQASPQGSLGGGRDGRQNKEATGLGVRGQGVGDPKKLQEKTRKRCKILYIFGKQHSYS